jgi:hypothetical protein
MGRVFILGMALFLASCSYPTIKMVHPVTGDVHVCKRTRPGRSRSAGRGEQLYPRSMMEKCVQQLEALGYKRSEDLTLEERERLTAE